MKINSPCALQFLDPGTRDITDFDKVIDEFNETRPEGSKCAKGTVGCEFDNDDNFRVTGDDEEMAQAFASFLAEVLSGNGDPAEVSGRNVNRIRAKESVN